MSYLEQQKKVEAEIVECERRKIEDDLEIKNEEAQKVSEAHALLHVENIEYEQCASIAEILPIQESDRISVRSKRESKMGLDMNTSDRPFVKLLRIYCFEWSCESEIFRKFQVDFIKL